ncbi:glycosidase [Frankia sp. Ag45/Mut15]|uniref:Glycosidase n=1 Tax=Frankia umida TaxID=573489 RepID=A0ABT0K4B2_9ACTN|nr:glycosyl hydrolase [Frankia umida]MCK9878639.1 glycosidase [Frankia umida]
MSRRRLALTVIAVLMLVATGLGACSSSSSSPTPGPRTTGVRWVSGANGNYPSEVNAWGTFAGRQSGLAIVFTDRRSWSGLVSAGWPTSAFTRAAFPGELSIAQPLYPQDGNEAACARGEYDRYWSQFGTTLTTYGRADAYVRLGWEFNGGYMYWHVRDVEAWKTCFRRTVTAIRSTDPAVRIDWNMNAHNDTLPVGKEDVWAAYPGDQYVDIVSIDAYDHYPASLTQATWNKQCHLRSGLCTVIQFARDHGKKFAVPEWGVVRSAGGGGDNPFYVSRMYETFAANAQNLAYEAYYRTAEDGNVKSSLTGPDLNPRASQRYLQLFGPSTS